MPTIYTGDAQTVMESGFKKGKTAQQLYNEDKAREEGRFRAEQYLKQQALEIDRERNQYERLDKIDRENRLLLQAENQQKIDQANLLLKGEELKQKQFETAAYEKFNQEGGVPPMGTKLYDDYMQNERLKESKKNNELLTEQRKQLIDLRSEQEDVRKSVPDLTNAIASGEMKISNLPDDKITKTKVILDFKNRIIPENIKQYGEETARVKNSAIYDKEMDSKYVEGLNKAQNVYSDLNQLESDLKEFSGADKLQPIFGIFEEKSPWATKSQKLKSEIKTLVTNMARGVYSEVGTFTDQDFKTYESVLPNIKNTDELNDLLLKMARDKVIKSIVNQIDNQARSHRDVSGYFDIYQKFKSYLENDKQGSNPVDNIYKEYKQSKKK